MKHIKKIADYSMVGGMGGLLIAAMSGCESPDHGLPPQQQGQSDAFQQASQTQGAFVVIEEIAPKQYKIVDEYPSSETRVILKSLDGTEKILSKEELDAMIKEEAQKIEEGKSPLTNPELSSTMGGLSLGETILASAAGAILGSWIGSKLFNNPNYQQQRRTSYKNPSTYSRSVNSFKKTKTTSAKKSGYFGSKSKSSTRSTSTRRSSGFFGSRSSSRSFGG
ncbi:MAG: hypothetical protein B6D59_08305 [Campylobacteraceae bacterium 4484_4]|nr:MAG: hypothetical protein B6D59_08305 [Campylobacteraceae bacterium 4484_4]